MKFRVRESREVTVDIAFIPKNIWLHHNGDAAVDAGGMRDTLAEIIEDGGLDYLLDQMEGGIEYGNYALGVAAVTAAPEPPRESVDFAPAEYDIEIVDQGFEPGTYGGWSIQFRVKDLPRLSYQSADPILDAFVRLETAEPDAPKLSSGGGGGGSALARTDDEASKLSEVMMGGGQEGGVLRGFTGAAVVEVAPVVFGNAPVAMPSDERIAAACRASVDAHLAAVAEERKRLAVTETVETSVVGKKMKV